MYGQYNFPLKTFLLLSQQQWGTVMPHFIIVLTCFTLVRNVSSVFVESVIFEMVKVDNFCMYELVTVSLKLFDGKDTRFVVSETER